jgi:hypothetical protein
LGADHGLNTHTSGRTTFQEEGRFTLFQAALGFSFNSARNKIRLINPQRPSFLDEAILHQLRLGNSSLDLAIGRHDGEVSLRVQLNK